MNIISVKPEAFRVEKIEKIDSSLWRVVFRRDVPNGRSVMSYRVSQHKAEQFRAGQIVFIRSGVEA